MRKKLIVIVGAGRGIGNHVAKKFGENNFQIVLIARNQKSLNEYVQEFESDGIEVHTQTADASNTESLTAAFEKIIKKYGAVDVLIYNATILQPGNPTSLSSEQLMERYQVDVASALHSAKQVLPSQLAQKEGTIIFTGGGLALHPVPKFTTVSMDKAALRALTFTLAEELKEKGIFVGTITIMGHVAPDTHFDPAIIADKYWEMYKTRKNNELVYE